MGVYDVKSSQFGEVSPADLETILSAPVEPYAPPAPVVPERSAPGEIANQFKAGAVVDLPRMAGQAIKYVSEEGRPLYRLGQDIVSGADERGALPENRPSEASEGMITGALASGARMIPQSIAPALAAAGAVALAPEALTVTALGAAGVGLLGAAGGAIPAGMSQGQETYEKVLRSQRQAGTPEEETQANAKKAGRLSGAIESGGETLGGLAATRLLGVAGKAGNSIIAKVLGKDIGAKIEQSMLGRLGLSYAEALGIEVPTEMGQGAGETAVERAYGIREKTKEGKDLTPWESAKEAIAPTIGMTTLMAPFGIPGHYNDAKAARTENEQAPGLLPASRLALPAPTLGDSPAVNGPLTSALATVSNPAGQGQNPGANGYVDAEYEDVTPMQLGGGNQRLIEAPTGSEYVDGEYTDATPPMLTGDAKMLLGYTPALPAPTHFVTPDGSVVTSQHINEIVNHALQTPGLDVKEIKKAMARLKPFVPRKDNSGITVSRGEYPQNTKVTQQETTAAQTTAAQTTAAQTTAAQTTGEQSDSQQEKTEVAPPATSVPSAMQAPSPNFLKLNAQAKKHGLSVSKKQADGSYKVGEQSFPHLAAVQEHINRLAAPATTTEEIPSHVVNAVAAPREVVTAVGTATKQQTKDTLNTFLGSGDLSPTNPIRLTTVEELHDIIKTGTLRPGKDFEGRSGISAQLVDGKKPIVAYGPNDKISAAIVFPDESAVGAGMAPNEVKINDMTDVAKLRFVVDGFKELMTFDQLKEAVGEKQTETGIPVSEQKQEGAEKSGKAWYINADDRPVLTSKQDSTGYRGPYTEQEVSDLTGTDESYLKDARPGEPVFTPDHPAPVTTPASSVPSATKTEPGVATSGGDVVAFVKDVLSDRSNNRKSIVIALPSAIKANKIKEETGIDIGAAREILLASSVIHVEDRHPNINEYDWARLPVLATDFVASFESVDTGKNGEPRLIFTMPGEGAEWYVYVGEPAHGKKKGARLNVVTFFKDHINTLVSHLQDKAKNKDSASVFAATYGAPKRGERLLTGSESDNSIPFETGDVKPSTSGPSPVYIMDEISSLSLDDISAMMDEVAGESTKKRTPGAQQKHRAFLHRMLRNAKSQKAKDNAKSALNKLRKKSPSPGLELIPEKDGELDPRGFLIRTATGLGQKAVVQEVSADEFKVTIDQDFQEDLINMVEPYGFQVDDIVPGTPSYMSIITLFHYPEKEYGAPKHIPLTDQQRHPFGRPEQKAKPTSQPAAPEDTADKAQAGVKPAEDNQQTPYFKEGERVQTGAGRHGQIVRAVTMVGTMINLSRSEGVTAGAKHYSHMYDVIWDNGVKGYGSFDEMSHEVDAAPAVVPAPMGESERVEPEALLRNIGYQRTQASNYREAAGRARKSTKIQALKDSAKAMDERADKQQKAFDEWATKYPEEAAKYQVKPAPAPAPAAVEQKAGTMPGLTVSLNAAKSGIELRFDGKPSEEILAKVKSNGFRWARGSRVWYAKDTPMRRQIVANWQGKPVGETGPAAEYELKANEVQPEGVPYIYHKVDMQWEYAVKPVSGEPSWRSMANPPLDFRDKLETLLAEKTGDSGATRRRKGPEVYDSVTVVPAPKASEQATTLDATDILKAAAAEGVKGAESALKGLHALFGGASLKSFPGAVDEETYAAARPHFKEALDHFVQAGKGLKEYIQFLFAQFGTGIKPYALRFLDDVKNNAPELRSDDIVKADAEEGGVESDRDELTEATEHDRAGHEGPGAEDVPGTEAVREVATGTGGPGRDPDGDVRRRVRRRTVPDSEEGQRPDRKRAGSDDGPSRSMGKSPGNGTGVSGRDYRIPAGGLKREGSWKTTAERNLDIIALVKKLDVEGRPATPEEQEILSKYTGFGASEIANKLFPGYAEHGKIFENWADKEWRPLVNKLLALDLSPAELKTLARSTQYAHYTSEGIVRGIYSALESRGFYGGKILEPGMGSGNFLGAMPDSIYRASRYTGLEIDHLTASIAKYLYPQQNILQADYTKKKLPSNFFDLAIGNPPFGKIPILTDPEYKRLKLPIHDYFFAKTIDRVRPGGLMVFVTSRYTMDKVDDKARNYLADRADLLGAVRLPQTAFAQHSGTEVVTDILFLRKHEPGVETSGVTWKGLKEIQTPEGPVSINEYYADHPEMVLGRNSLQGSMYGANQYTVLPNDGSIDEQFAAALENLPENIYSSARVPAEEKRVQVAERDFNPKIKKEGGIYLNDDGVLMRVEHGAGQQLDTLDRFSKRDMEWLVDYVPLRDALKQAKADQWDDGDWEVSLKEASSLYKKFVSKHGRILEYTTIEKVTQDEDGNDVKTVARKFKNNSLLKKDTEGALVFALEAIDDHGNIKEAAFLKERTIRKPDPPQVKTLSDALAVSLDTLGSFDLNHVAEMANVSRPEVIEGLGDLVYETTDGAWQLSDEYLSGNVVRKLEEAEQAARMDDRFKRNVEALSKVQPKPLTNRDISVKLGSTWLDPGVIEEFASEVLGAPMSINYVPATGKWIVTNSAPKKKDGWYYGRRGAPKAARPQGLRGAGGEWSTADRGPNELLDSILNNLSIKITRTDESKKTYTDTEATAAANEKASEIRKRFSAWIWEDSERAGILLDEYNKRFNNIAPRRFDGSHLTLPGVSLKYKLHPHQLRAIWRVIQTGDTYLAHAVGAGKTIEMISAGMEMKRLGLIAKPLYVVPNHMLEQFSSEFMDLYPLANIMVADETNFHTSNRRRFMAQAAMNNPDAVIITHSSYGLLGMKPENVTQVRDEILDELREYLSELADEEGAKSQKVKQLESRIEAAEQRFDSIAVNERADQSMTFEELGCDFVFVDEAHQFRKLDFTTSRQVKGIDPQGSRAALDMYVKTRWLQSRRPGRAIVFASGTPITNTIGELYTIQRFFNHSLMEEDGIHHFDAWSAMFGEVEPGFEMNAAGRYEVVERFSRFDNLPELSKRVRMFMDVLTSDQLSAYVKRPEIKGGQPEIVVVPPSEEMKDYQQHTLLPRIERSKKWKPTREERFNPDPVIAIIADGRLAAIDMRFVDNSLPSNPDSKLNRMIDGIIEAYHETKDLQYTDKETGATESIKGGAQIVFYNQGMGAGVAKNRGFDARAWVMKRLKEAKIPAKEIAWIDDYPTADKKEAMMKEVRQGQKRILFGSAKKMGTGINVQKRLVAMHYLDPPWYPADVTQPDGRILRQGNQNEVVTLKRYATKGSYDSTQWQMVARKAKAIESFLNGDDSVRSIEDLSESNQFAMASALASGDERVIQLAGLQADVERLTTLQNSHAQEQSTLRYMRTNAESNIKWAKGRIYDLKEAGEKIGGHIREFTGDVGGREYTNREEFGQALLDKYTELVDGMIDDPPKKGGTKPLGTINGFRISLQYHVSTNLDTKSTYVRDPSFLLEITDKISGTVVRADYGKFELNESPRGLTDKIINTLNGVARELRELEQKEQDLQEELAVIVKRLGAPYSYAKELAEKVAEVTRLQNELAAEGEQQAADTGTLPGQEFIEEAGDADALYSNPMFNPKLIVNSLSGLAGNLKEDIPKLVRLGQRVIHEGASTFQAFAKAMKGYLGDKWGTFKNRMLSVFGKAKEAYRNSPLGNDVGAIGDVAGVKSARNAAAGASAAADSIISAAKDYVSSASPETMAKNAARLLNPTDVSMATRALKETFPRVADAIGWLFNIPTFQGERDARNRKADEVSIKDFVDAGINRANNNMEFQLEMQGWDGLDPTKARKAPSFWQRIKEGVTTWEAADATTEWGRIEKDVRKNLDQKQRDALDIMQREGDIGNKVYDSLSQAMKNRRIAAAKPTQAVFDAYKRVRNFIDGPMVEARERLIQRLGESTGADKELVAKTIKAYRAQIGELKGWMPRKHGEGVHQVNVYHTIRSLPFVARAIDGGHAATLPFYAGKDVQREIRKFAREHMLVIHRGSTGAPIVIASDKTREKIQEAIATLEGRLAKTSDEMKKVLYEEQLQALHSKLAIASRPSDVRIQEFMESSKGFLSNVRSQYEVSMQPLRNQMAEARAKGAHKGEILRIKSEMDKLGDGTVKVKVYMRLNETQRQAEKLKAEVAGNISKTLDHVYHPGEQYTTTYKVIDPASEGMFGDIAGDFAAENIIKKAIDRAQQAGKIGGEDAAGVRDSLFRNYADIMLSRGAGRSQITRAPYLIQGYDQADTNQLYHDYMTSAAGMLSKAMYAKQQFDNYRYAPAEIKPWAETYIKDTLRNMGHADRIGANVRAVATFMYLGFKVSSVLVNGTQTWTLGVAELGRRTKQNSVKAISKAQLDILRSKLSADEQALFDNQLWKEQEMATAIHEMSGHGEGATGKASKFLHTLVGKSLIPFQEMEMMNRRTMVLAAYRSFLADGMNKKNAISEALDVNRMTNFEMSRANLPTWAHHPAGRTAYALQSFVWNNWNWIYNRATSGEKADMLALLKYASMIAAIGGVTALGGGDEANKIIRRLTGKDYRLAMEVWSRKHAKEYGTVGELMNAAVWHGGMGALGVNISNAMRLNIPMSGFITGESTAGESAMGIWSGLADKAGNAAMYASRGQYGRAVESAAPEVIASPMKAYRMATQGATTSHGKPIFDESGKLLKYSGLDAAKRAVGIQPLEQSFRSEVTQSTKATQSYWRDQRSTLMDSLRMAHDAGDRKSVVKEILKFNKDVRRSQAWPAVGIITAESIRRSRAASKPDKNKQAVLRKTID